MKDHLPVWATSRKIEWMQHGVKPINRPPVDVFPGKEFVQILTMGAIELPDQIWVGDLNVTGTTHAVLSQKVNDILKHICYMHRPTSTTLEFPFEQAKWTLYDGVKRAIENGIPRSVIESTVSCEAPEPGHCGLCPSCLRRWGVFQQLGLQTEFAQNPLDSRINLQSIMDLVYAHNKAGHNPVADRCKEILPKVFEHLGTNNLADVERLLNAKIQLAKN